MAVNLEKGQNHVLNMNTFHIGLGWDVNENTVVDLDVSAFMLNGDKKTPEDNYLVFYNSEKRLKVYLDGPNKGELVKPLSITPHTFWNNNDDMRQQSRPVDPELSVIGSIDDELGDNSEFEDEAKDDETMDIDLSKVRSDIQEIIITVSIHKYAERRQNFGQVERAYVRLYKKGHEQKGKEDFIYDLSEDFSTCASVEFCRLYRRNGEWKIQATGIGHRGGLEELVNKFM